MAGLNVGALLSAVALIAGIAPARAVAAPAEPKPMKAFKADLSGLVILPSGRPTEAEKPRQFRDKEEIFRVPLGLDSVGRLAEPTTITMFGKPVSFSTSQLLTTATARGGDLDRYPGNRVVLCADPDANFAKQLAAATTLLLSTLFSRFQPWTQICLVDTDGDGSVEHAFMVGTRQDADRRLFPIRPVRYAIGRNVPLADSYVAYAFSDPALLAGPRIVINVVVAGQQLNVDRLKLGDTRKLTKVNYGLKPGELPRTIEIAGSQVTVDALAADGKTVTAHYVRDATAMPFDYLLVPTTIYIYH